MQTRLIVKNDHGTLIDIPIKSMEFDNNSLLCEFRQPTVSNGRSEARPVPRRKKRATIGGHIVKRRAQRGVKLSANQVREIRARYRKAKPFLQEARDGRTNRFFERMAKQYNCSKTNIQFICYRLIWKHVR